MKYIISNNNDLVIFSEGLKHSDVSQKLNLQTKSAGFITEKLKPFGESFSLRIGRGENDEQIINNHFNNL